MNLNDDLILEILLRLPVQSLLRLKYVCKKWCDLIESSSFVNAHLQLSNIVKGNECILIKHFDGIKIDIVLSSYYNNSSSSMISCLASPAPPPSHVWKLPADITYMQDLSTHCNGIVCLTDQLDTITLLNVALREIRTLPPTPFECPYEFLLAPFGVGFWFDGDKNQYKVVSLGCFSSIVYKPAATYLEAQSYDFNTNSWKILSRKHVDITAIYNLMCPIIFNEILHACFKGTVSKSGDFTNHIITFNTTTNLFQIMELPFNWTDYYGDDGTMYPSMFVVDKSTIALVVYTYINHTGNRLDVWLMTEYGVKESWVRQYSMTSPDFIIGKPISFWRKDQLLFMTKDDKLICYDLPIGHHHQLRRYRFQPLEYAVHYFGIVIYNETLVSVNKI